MLEALSNVLRRKLDRRPIHIVDEVWREKIRYICEDVEDPCGFASMDHDDYLPWQVQKRINEFVTKSTLHVSRENRRFATCESCLEEKQT